MRRSACTFFIVVILVSNGHAYAADYSVLTVALVSTSWNTGLPTAVARGMGYFAEEGLEVRLVTLATSGPIMMALLMSAQAQMVIAGRVAILRGIAHGAPVVIIGGELSKMSYALMGAKRLQVGDRLPHQKLLRHSPGRLYSCKSSGHAFALSQFRSPAYNFDVDVVQSEELVFFRE